MKIKIFGYKLFDKYKIPNHLFGSHFFMLICIKTKKLIEYLNRIINGDCLEVMKDFPDKCVDLVVTSPPYNLKNSSGNGMKDGRGGKWKNAELINGYADHDDCMPHEEYIKWQNDCLKR